MWYFAYGHNTNDAEMRKRLPDAVKVGRGVLRGYRLVMHKYASIEPCEGSMMGVVWDLTPNELKELDFYEEVPFVYKRKKVKIEVDGEEKTAVVYIMTTPLKGVPSKQYMKWLREGYRKNKLLS